MEHNHLRKIIRTIIKEQFSPIELVPFYEDMDFDFEEEYGIDEYQAQGEALSIAKNSNVTILSDKELSALLINKEESNVVGAIWFNNDSDNFSFDLAIDASHRGKKLSSKLIEFAIEEYHSRKDVYGDNYKMEVDVINPLLASILERKYKFHVIEKIGPDRVLMGLN